MLGPLRSGIQNRSLGTDSAARTESPIIRDFYREVDEYRGQQNESSISFRFKIFN